MDNAPRKKLRVGWFSFSCCEDSTVVFTELMNDHWEQWKRLIDFRHARVLQTKNVLDELDVAFIEGALATPAHVAKAKEIRAKSAMVVAIGACACMGQPSAQRNDFDAARKEEIQALIDRFSMSPRVQKVADVIQVDAQVPGCPMQPNLFLNVLDQALARFHILPAPTHAHG